MVWGAVIGAGAGLLGGILNNSANKSAAKQQYRYDKELQQMNIDWQKEAMQNSHQWAVEDLQKAGLNPAIASSGGASTGGASASQSGPTVNPINYADVINSAIGTYNESRKTDAEILKTISDTANVDSQTAQNIANTEIVKKYGSEKAKTEIANNLAEIGVKSSQSAKNLEETNRIKGGQTANMIGTATTGKIGKALKDIEKQAKKKELDKKGYKKGPFGLWYYK